MSDREAPETIPISHLNALEYCPRRFFYEFVEGDMVVNDFVLAGTLMHERVDEPGKRMTEDGTYQINRVYLYSEKLRLAGFADVVEEQNGSIIPVEYKHGRQGKWLNDHIQLGAQALCLEERQLDGLPIPFGYIFYFGSRKRVQVYFTKDLRAQVKEAINQVFEVAMLGSPPPPLEGKLAIRCRDCSLASICLPEEVKMLKEREGNSFANTLFN